MPLARTLMVQGTASSVGKSLLVTALCRIFARQGLRVAPFKAQNMSLNAAVTRDGLEIGRAQAVQAQAAGIDACVEMNPILLKPEGEQRSQLIVLGRAVGHVTAKSYFSDDRQALRDVIASSLNTLRAAHDLVVIEGAGSPAEVNLKQRDLVNMHVAKLADAPVLLVGDIDRGGVFASLLGTLDLLDPEERARVAGLVVNKFRGDPSLFHDGVQFLQARSGKPMLGVIPYLPQLAIADEDSQAIAERADTRWHAPDVVRVAVVRLPRMSNHDDVLSLEHAPSVALRFVDDAQSIHDADLVILPGSKSTTGDLTWLRAQGLAEALRVRAERGGYILGVCGGCQMLGERIDDPDHVEASDAVTPGLGLLPLTTRFHAHKTTAQVRAAVRAVPDTFLTSTAMTDHVLRGYEIHHGAVHAHDPARCLFDVTRHDGTHTLDGVVNRTGHVIGTLLHGILDNAALRAHLLERLGHARGLPTMRQAPATAGDDIERLADHVSRALDMPTVRRIVGLPPALVPQER